MVKNVTKKAKSCKMPKGSKKKKRLVAGINLKNSQEEAKDGPRVAKNSAK